MAVGSIIDWLVVWQEALQKIRQKNTMRREVTVELSSQGFWKTGIRSDVCQVTHMHKRRHVHAAAAPHLKNETYTHVFINSLIQQHPLCDIYTTISEQSNSKYQISVKLKRE